VSYSIFVFVCARLSWPSRQLTLDFERTFIYCIVLYRMIADIEIENWSCDPDLARFRGSLLSAC